MKSLSPFIRTLVVFRLIAIISSPVRVSEFDFVVYPVNVVPQVSVELHVKTRIDLRPDPDMDEIRCLFYCLDSDSWTGSETGMRTGAIVVDPASASEVIAFAREIFDFRLQLQ